MPWTSKHSGLPFPVTVTVYVPAQSTSEAGVGVGVGGRFAPLHAVRTRQELTYEAGERTRPLLDVDSVDLGISRRPRLGERVSGPDVAPPFAGAVREVA